MVAPIMQYQDTPTGKFRVRRIWGDRLVLQLELHRQWRQPLRDYADGYMWWRDAKTTDMLSANCSLLQMAAPCPQ